MCKWRQRWWNREDKDADKDEEEETGGTLWNNASDFHRTPASSWFPLSSLEVPCDGGCSRERYIKTRQMCQ